MTEPAAASPGMPPALFQDGLGTRLEAIRPDGGPVEVFELAPQLCEGPAFEFALRKRVNTLKTFQHDSFASVLGVRLGGSLAVVSDRVDGVRLSTMLAAMEEQEIFFEFNAAVCILRQLVPAVAALHELAPDISHGSIAPERCVVTADGRLVVVEHMLGSVLDELMLSEQEYWAQYRVALPKTAGLARLDQRADVLQIGLVALALIHGRSLDDSEYPNGVAALAEKAWGVTVAGTLEPLPASMRAWLSRALQLDPRTGFASAASAAAELDQVLAPSSRAEELKALTRAFARAGVGPAGASLATVSPASAPAAAATPPKPAAEPASASAPVPAAAPAPPSIAAAPMPAAVAAAPTPAPVAAAPAPAVIAAAPAPKPAVVAAAPATPVPSAADAPKPMPKAAASPEPLPAAAARITEAVAAPSRPVVPAADRPANPIAIPDAAPQQVFGRSLFTSPGPHPDRDQEEQEEQNDMPTNTAWWRRRWVAAAAAVAAIACIGLAAGRSSIMPSAAAAVPGTLIVNSNPPGVPVVLDGQRKGQTPVTLEVSAGSHVLTLLTGDSPRTIPLTITAGSTVSQFVDIPVPASLTGQLQIRTEPSAARVTVDGTPRGVSPLTIEGLSPGTHTVEVVSDLGSVRQDITVEAGTTASLFVPMTAAGLPQGAPISGWISVSAPVDVQIYEDDRLLGSSRSDRVMVSVGRHELDIVNEALGYRQRRTVNVAPGQVAAVKLDMPNGTMALNAQPWAEVWIDGQRIGETPIGSVAVPIGTHDVVFRHPELGEQVVRSTVTLGEPVRLSVDLRKK